VAGRPVIPTPSSRSHSGAGEVGGRSWKTVVANAMENLLGRKTRIREARIDEVGLPGASEERGCLLARVKSQIHGVRMSEAAARTSRSCILNGSLLGILRGDPIDQSRISVSVLVHQARGQSKNRRLIPEKTEAP
jgi:hypothetical protein